MFLAFFAVFKIFTTILNEIAYTSSLLVFLYLVSFCNLLVLQICVLVLIATVFDNIDNIPNKMTIFVYPNGVFPLACSECSRVSVFNSFLWKLHCGNESDAEKALIVAESVNKFGHSSTLCKHQVKNYAIKSRQGKILMYVSKCLLNWWATIIWC